MKKSVLSIAIGAALLIAPMTASALTPMTADSLKDATGQAGVSIAIDGVKLESHVGEVRYTDTDGYVSLEEKVKATLGDEPTDLSTSVVIGSKHTVKYINAITAYTGPANPLFNGKGTTSSIAAQHTKTGLATVDTDSDTTNGAEAGWTGYGYTNYLEPVLDGSDAIIPNAYAEKGFKASALSIDVGTCDVLTAGIVGNIAMIQGLIDMGATYELGNVYTAATDLQAVAGVVIGLPTLEIHTATDSYDVGIEQTAAAGEKVALNSGDKFIKVTKGASTLAILGGTLEIAPH